LVRHGQTDWNAQHFFSGQTDIPINKIGRQQAKTASNLLRKVPLHKAYSSQLSRAKETLEIILVNQTNKDIEIIEDFTLNERKYGLFEGKNKEDSVKIYGTDVIRKVRRAWNYPIEGGETLKDVHDRLIPFYEKYILNDLKSGMNIIISSHNNTIRALIKYLESISPKDIEDLTLNNADIIIYTMDKDGRVTGKEIRQV
jgi:2,3-bisphosphoglycerate-dependent phosphoglycerate mutase